MRDQEQILSGDFLADADRALKSDTGRQVFSIAHPVGKALLSAFGAGALAQPIEQLEQQQGYLSRPDSVVSSPDYVVAVSAKGKAAVLPAMAQVGVYGGRRFAGNGYVSGEQPGQHYSFGIDAPTRIDLVARTGEKTTLTDVRQVLFLGGVEATQRVSGDADMDDEDLDKLGCTICGELGEPINIADTGVETHLPEDDGSVYVIGTDVLAADCDVVGAAPHGFGQFKPPTASVKKPALHAKSVAALNKHATAAASWGKKALTLSKKYKPLPKIAVKGMPTILGELPIIGTIVGALSPKTRAATAAQRLNRASARHAAAAKKSAASGQAAVDAAKRAKEAASKLKVNLDRLRKGQKVIGWDSAEWVEIVGGPLEISIRHLEQSVLGDDGSPPDGSSTDTSAPSAFDPSAFRPGNPVPGEEDPNVVWHKVPADGVVRDAALGFDPYSKGSAGYFLGPQGGVGGSGSVGMIWAADDAWHAPFAHPGNHWVFRYGQAGMDTADILHSVFNPVFGVAKLLGGGNDNWDDGFATDAAAAKQSLAKGNAPLIGAPEGYTLWKGSSHETTVTGYGGMRYAIDDDKWFWPWSLAPDAAKMPILQAAADAAKVAQDAAQKAADAHTAVMNQIAAQQEEQAARNQLVQAQADADAQAAQTKRDSDQADAQAKFDQAQMEMEIQRQQAAQDQGGGGGGGGGGDGDQGGGGGDQGGGGAADEGFSPEALAEAEQYASEAQAANELFDAEEGAGQ